MSDKVDISGALSALDNMTRVLKAFEGARVLLSALQSAEETTKALAKRVAEFEKAALAAEMELTEAQADVAKAKDEGKEIRAKARGDAEATAKRAKESADNMVNKARTTAESLAAEAGILRGEIDRLKGQKIEVEKQIRGLEQTRKDAQAAVNAIVARANAPAA